MHIEALSTSPKPNSRSRRLLEAMSLVLGEQGVSLHVTDIRDLPVVLCVGGHVTDYPERYGALASRLEACDGVLIAASIHNYSVAGACRNLVEIVGDSLEGCPVGLLAGAGTVRSHMAVLDFMNGLAFEYRSFVYPSYVMLAGNATPTEVAEFPGRLVRFAAGFTDFCRRLDRGGARRGSTERAAR